MSPARIVSLLLAIGIAAAHAAPPSGMLLDHAGLLKRVIGNTLHVHSSSEDVYEFLAPDGSIHGESTLHGRYAARWRFLQMDSLCLEHADPMASGCVFVHLQGIRVEFHRRDGVIEGPLELLPGNPRRL